MLLINLDRNSNISLFKQIFEQIKSMIDDAVLKPGDRLPSSRRLSDNLGVNRTTVTKAYEELWGIGLYGEPLRFIFNCQGKSPHCG